MSKDALNGSVSGSSATTQLQDDILDKNKSSVVLKHAQWCGHCKNFYPTWNAIFAKFKDNKNITFYAVESAVLDSNAKLSKLLDSPGYPTIFFCKNGKATSYNSSRDAEVLEQSIKEDLLSKGKKKAK